MTAIDMIASELDEEPAIVPKSRIHSIVVATDGSDSALAAFKAADLICARNGAEIHVLSVLEPVPPIPVMFAQSEGMILPLDFEQSRVEARRAVIRDQIIRFDSAAQWTVDLRLGRPAEVIVDYAREQEADLIILGANRHSVWGRLFGEETAMEVSRLTDTALLVASPEMTRLPKRVIVAMDLNPRGLQLAPQALEAIADSASVSAVHVKPSSGFLGISSAEFDSHYERVMKTRFTALEAELEAVHMRPDLIVLHGAAAHELIDYASFAKGELLVVGVKRRLGRARAVGGRMAGRIVRQASCSVLIVPNLIPQDAIAALPEGTTEVLRDSRLWSNALREFTARNAGRIVNLEVDDAELGALAEVTRYPLLGVDYDHKDGRVTISLGSTRGLDRHLTRAIAKPESVSVLSVEGRDTAMSVVHAGGQTLLTF
ncbi:MAG: universal stress protein [Gemmatimonadales bacterium]